MQIFGSLYYWVPPHHALLNTRLDILSQLMKNKPYLYNTANCKSERIAIHFSHNVIIQLDDAVRGRHFIVMSLNSLPILCPSVIYIWILREEVLKENL